LGFARAEIIRKLSGSFLPLNPIVNRRIKKRKKGKRTRERERQRKKSRGKKNTQQCFFENRVVTHITLTMTVISFVSEQIITK
jgi:hypothetical protein